VSSHSLEASCILFCIVLLKHLFFISFHQDIFLHKQLEKLEDFFQDQTLWCCSLLIEESKLETAFEFSHLLHSTEFEFFVFDILLAFDFWH
jgi:hypothetical protein